VEARDDSRLHRVARSNKAPSGEVARKRGQGKGRNKRFKRAPVYIDGEVVGVLRHSELPPGLQARWRYDAKPFPTFSLADYLERLGAKLDRVSEVHLTGGNRIAVISGKELRRVRDQLHFSFSRANAGKARMEWPEARLDISTKIDKIASIAVYQRKAAPRYDLATRGLYMPDGTLVEGVPYADPAQKIHGTRVYVDGRFSAAMRRRNLPVSARSSKEAATDDRDASYSLRSYLTHLGVDPNRVRAVDLIVDDRTVGRIEAAEFGTHRATLIFTVPGRSGGKAHMRVPTTKLAKLGEVKLEAITAYVHAAPPPLERRPPVVRDDS
jgi:hypothetical protein